MSVICSCVDGFRVTFCCNHNSLLPGTVIVLWIIILIFFWRRTCHLGIDYMFKLSD